MVARWTSVPGGAAALLLALASCAAFSGGRPAEPVPDPDGGGAEDGAAAPADGAAAATCHADLTSDPANCGWCGHDCLGSSCSNAQCGPTKLFDGADSIAALATDASNVYWSSYTYTAGAPPEPPMWSVSTCPKAGCVGAPTVLFTSYRVAAIAVGGAAVYAVSQLSGAGYSIVSCATTGCGGLPTSLAMTDATEPTGLIVDAQAVYWIEPAEGVFACPPTGACTKTQLTTVGGTHLTEYAGELYWITATTTIVACDPASCAEPRTVAGGVINGFAVGGPGIFWTDGADNGTVTRLPPGSDQPTPFAKAEYRPSGVLTDGDAVYWLTSAPASGSVRRSLASGGGAATVASGQDSPAQIQIDDRWIYWADSTSIWRVAK